MSGKKFPDKETRYQNAIARLGGREPFCVICGFDDHPAALELAHVAGKNFHDDVAVLCSNCHRRQSDGEKDRGFRPQTYSPELESMGHYLLGLATFLGMLSKTLPDFGERLIEQAEKAEVEKPGEKQ